MCRCRFSVSLTALCCHREVYSDKQDVEIGKISTGHYWGDVLCWSHSEAFLQFVSVQDGCGCWYLHVSRQVTGLSFSVSNSVTPLCFHLSPQVTLMLLDQNNREHIIDAFRPDVTSSSFQRPVTEMNIASGCPLFCPVSVMEAKNSYVRDDAIFIKAIVDLTGL